jgi:hypothetical protein
MTTNLGVLTQFKEYIKDANAGNKGFYENIEKNFNLKTKVQFEALITEQLETAEHVKDEKLLVNLLEKTIKPCLDKKAELLKQLNDAITENKLEQLKKFFNELLKPENKKVIVDELWEAYYASQTNGSYLSNLATDFGKRTEGAFATNYSQSQADPLKRVGMILFEALFTFFDYALYKSSNGQERLSVEYEFKPGNAEDSFKEMNKMKYGVGNVPAGTGEAPTNKLQF